METDKVLPPLSEVKALLRPLTFMDQAAVIALPLLTIAAYFAFSVLSWYVAAFMSLVYLSFVSYGSCCHDLVHANFGLSRKACNIWLSVIELLLMRSGTTYRVTHLNHHKFYPDYEKDPEGRASYFSLVRTLLEGPVFHPKLILWTLKNGSADDRQWVKFEVSGIFVFYLIGIFTVHVFPALFIYQVTVTMGAWIIPLITSYLVHVPHEREPIRQTRLFRGAFYRVLAFDHLYHLEHHLYPQIPHCRWRDLALLLNVHFEKQGLTAVRFRASKSRNLEIN